ncbi:aldo/keto reductase [Cognatishimia sp. F0-27]|uniref:aldo/keto reductase n=1 Tax=Cognatishimia sp. F0-27 TaxID=2816855 RepID=UPI001D0C2210|nr:aldo/keto reductase [Cognatishimia sp. F0-27]MCC1494584.1 aldo/keto reductase [Cognatishimia sp. F0-27]
MKTRSLLQTGQSVPEIGLGCMNFTGFYGPSSDAEAQQTMARAVDLGITFFDTSNIYGFGQSETMIGAFLRSTGADITLATKAGIWRDATHGNRGFNNTSAYLRTELEGSLRRLGVDRVDLFYVHRRDPSVEIEAVMETLLTFKEEGKIGGIGFSEIAPASLKRALAVGPVDAVQSEYSLWTRQPELGLIQACAASGVALVPYSPLGRGMFAQDALDPARFADGDWRRRNPRFQEPNFSHNREVTQRFHALARDLGIAPATLALAWCLSRGPHVIPIPGTRSAAHLDAIAAASDFVLTPDIAATLDGIMPVGWAHGDRYSADQWNGPEGYC